MTGAPLPVGGEPGPPADPFDAGLALAPGGPEVLAVFNRAGVLASGDVHLARRLSDLAGEGDDLVALAVALAGRAPRVGHVSVDLATVRASAVVAEEDDDIIDLLPWPDTAEWVERVAASTLVGTGGGGGCRPLHLDGTHLYLDRYWRHEMAVASELLRRALPAPSTAPAAIPAAGGRLERLFPGAAARDQREAAAVALSGRLTVIAGGPGTGKTTTVARLLALLAEQAVGAGRRPPLIGLAAPTGKAAARMEEAIRTEAARMEAPPAVKSHLDSVAGVTIHRLLGSRPDRASRFRHHRGHRLPHDVVVIDEASMVSLALMARLLEAVRPDAPLILVGDPEQLVSVEAGAVLADIVGPAGNPAAPPGTAPPPGESAALAARIALLRTNHRFSGPLAELAAAIRSGDADRTLEVLAPTGVAGPEVTAGPGGPAGTAGTAVRWLPADADRWDGAGWEGDGGGLRPVLTGWAAEVIAEARAGRSRSALDVLSRHRLLCAHRDGPAGVAVWNRRIEEWAAAVHPALEAEGAWYAGRPVMVTANDYGLRLFNGDTGVVIATPSPAEPTAPAGPATPTPAATPVAVAVEGAAGRIRTVSPYRLPAVDTVFATTVHKSQGSEYDHVTVVLPPESSRLLTRELLYTAVTRARRSVVVVGSEEAVRRAVEHPLSRASGLGHRLWGR